MNLTIRNVEIEGRGGLDVRLQDGKIADIGPGLSRSGPTLEGEGGALIPGLADHHIHLLALAAQEDSVSLAGVATAVELAARVAEGLASRPPGAWLRVTGYHEQMAGNLGREQLDLLAPRHRLRIQHQTGSLWMLNSLALGGLDDGAPPGLERDGAGRPTGRLWRGDAWLRGKIAAPPPPLAAIGRRLASHGIVALTDASVTTDRSAAELLATAAREGDLPQRLMLMSGGALEAPGDGAFRVGPVKILLDDHALPDFDEMVAKMVQAHAWRRPVAVHCVTASELAVTLAAFAAAGSRPGDRIEHGSVIPLEAVTQIRELGLTVVTQPGFVRERGDRYLAEVEPEDLPDLYRCASLLAQGVALAGSSDAPYSSTDPWRAIAAAIDRRSVGGQVLEADERLAAPDALRLYLGGQAFPGGAPRRVAVGGLADLCLLAAPLAASLADPLDAKVRATLVGGNIVYDAA